MRAYIEIAGGIALEKRELQDSDVREIGKFTRENVLNWMNNNLVWPNAEGILPVYDFHAVCGDIDIPWATERMKSVWAEAYPNGYPESAIMPYKKTRHATSK